MCVVLLIEKICRRHPSFILSVFECKYYSVISRFYLMDLNWNINFFYFIKVRSVNFFIPLPYNLRKIFLSYNIFEIKRNPITYIHISFRILFSIKDKTLNLKLQINCLICFYGSFITFYYLFCVTVYNFYMFQL